MTTETELFERAARAFNTINIVKGQIVSIATCNNTGCPDVAPIGSMRVVDSNTVHVLQGFLPRTMRNLECNPLAAFSVVLRTSMFTELWGMFRNGPDAPLGYRLYGKLMNIDDDLAAVRSETAELVKRVPFVMRSAFTGFCDRNLRRLLKFEILEIRAT